MPGVLERTVLAAAALAAVLSLVDTTAGPAAPGRSPSRPSSASSGWRPTTPGGRCCRPIAVAWLAVGLVADLPGFARIAGGVSALALLAVAGALTTGLPVPNLPRPDGRFGVGIVTTMEERGTRRLHVKVWYPAEMDPARRRHDGEPLWSELREAPGVPFGLRLLTGYLREVRTHAVRGAPLRPGRSTGSRPSWPRFLGNPTGTLH